MTLFFISAALLVLFSVAWLMLGLFRSKGSDTDQEAVNITLARERRATLDAALAIVAVFVPITAGALYLHLGNPAAITQPANAPVQAAADAGQTAPSLVELLPQIEERLAERPDDIEGWRLLGRTYLSTGEFDKSKAAFEKALALDESDVPTMAQLAEAAGMTQQGDLSGEPRALVTRANELDPENEHALWLLSIARQQAGDHQAAVEGFDILKAKASENPEAIAMIDQMRARSMQALSGEQATPMTIPAPVPNEEQAEASISVTVDLSDEARAASSDDQVVFIYATATQGPPMPLAVSRLSVADLPVTVVLDNSMAMIPTMTLSTFDSVTVGARISTTGNAVAQQGDWFNEAPNIEPSTTDEISLVIDQQTP